MVAISPDCKAKQLMVDLSQLDKKIEEFGQVLKQNNVDMKTPLVDSEGFPSSAIDVAAVRIARHNIICLQNDRKKLMTEIEEAIQQAHQTENPASSSEQAPETVHRTSNKPFVKVDSVESNSPAKKAGIKEEDLIIQFGPLHAGNFTGFPQLKSYVQESTNTTIKVTVYRENSNSSSHVFRLELRPQSWEGAGTVGCKFSVIKDEQILATK